MTGGSMKNIAIIPARSQSKGLKDKNIRPLCGRPMIAYTVEAARRSGLFAEVMVSTDSERYADIARGLGANVPFLRSAELSSDTASSWDVVREVLDRYEEMGEFFETFALLQPTSPLRKAADIAAAYGVLAEKDANAVVGVTQADHPPAWYGTLPGDGSLTGFFKDAQAKQMRQKQEIYYRINGAIYIAKTAYFRNAKDIYESGCYAYVMGRDVSVDIDDELDFTVAEALLPKMADGFD